MFGLKDVVYSEQAEWKDQYKMETLKSGADWR